MKNRFFRIALGQASRLAGKPGRMLQLAGQIAQRLYLIDRKQISVVALREKLKVLGRLIAAYARGQYRHIPVKTLVTILAGLLYFLNPLDLIPDVILGAGLLDDLAVLTWVYQSAGAEVERFVEWEASAGSA